MVTRAVQAVESFALCLKEWGLLGAHSLPQRIDVMLFTAASAAILHCYSDAQGVHRDVFRSKYLNVLDFILGSSGALHLLFPSVDAKLVSGWHTSVRVDGRSQYCTCLQGWRPARSDTCRQPATS